MFLQANVDVLVSWFLCCVVRFTKELDVQLLEDLSMLFPTYKQEHQISVTIVQFSV